MELRFSAVNRMRDRIRGCSLSARVSPTDAARSELFVEFSVALQHFSACF
jgi:hypothetical protein